MTPAELLNDYLQIRASERSPGTLYNYKHMIEPFVDFLTEQGVTHAMGITAHHLIGFRARLATSKLRRTTAYARFLTVRTWLRWAFHADHILYNPGQELREKRPVELPRFTPTQEQVEIFLKTPNPRHLWGKRARTAFEILYGTGLRRFELLKLNLQDVQVDPPALWVRRGKGGKDRLQPIGDALAAVLAKYVQHIRPLYSPQLGENSLLIDDEGKRWRSGAFGKAFETYARKSGIPQLSAHGLRHAFATHLLENGADLHQISLLLGHSNLRVTERYTRIQPLELQKIYRRFHPRAHRRSGRGK